MNRDWETKIQAWVDGELPATEQESVAARVAQDPEAAVLVGQLRQLKSVLVETDPVRPVPDTREFYWSGIERRILQLSRPIRAGSDRVPLAMILRWFIPVGIAACIALILSGPLLRGWNVGSPLGFTEIESPLEDVSSVTFRSESEKMTVVWVNSRP